MKKNRNFIILVLTAVVVVLLLVGRPYLQHGMQSWAVFHDAAPSQQAVIDVLDRSSDPVASANRLWNTGHVATRIDTMDYLRRHAVAGSAFWPGVRSVVLDAARCGDMDVEQSALGILKRNNDPDTASVAAGMLQDLDPEVRDAALIYLQRTKDKRFVPLLIQALDDPDAKVVSFAAADLGELTGRDSGIRYEAGDTVSQPDIQAGIAKWKSWWAKHQADYPRNAITPPAGWELGPGVKETDFALQDLSGKTVRLSDFRGKVVLLDFWATWCTSCMADMPDLAELQRLRPDIVVLGVNVDADPDEVGDTSGTSKDLASKVKAMAAGMGIAYPIVLDHDGQAIGPYGGGDLPVEILIDPTGMVRRRMIGPRSIKAWERLADGIQPHAATARAG